MNEITYQKSYQELKEELKTELNRTVESFVRIGYLLKVARDTDILEQSEYDNVVDFAKAEYGIDKTQVSRFIHINDKFSEGGYADHLLPEYQGYGYAKLTIMLQLPDAINEALSPEYTKSEIQQIKNEIDEEKKISDLEVMMETRKVPGGSLIKRVIEKIGEDVPELFVQIAEILKKDGMQKEIMDVMAPDGEKTYSVRVPAEGRIMLMISETECRMVNTRSGERTDTDKVEIIDEWKKLIKDIENPKKCWSELYCQKFPEEEKQEVAPVQQKKESKVQVKKTEKTQKTESKKETYAEKREEITEEEVAKDDKSAAGEKTNINQLEEDVDCEMPAAGEEETVIDVEAKVIPDDNIIRGHKAAISNNLNALKKLWEGDTENKIEMMLEKVKDLQWRLERLKESEEV